MVTTSMALWIVLYIAVVAIMVAALNLEVTGIVSWRIKKWYHTTFSPDTYCNHDGRARSEKNLCGLCSITYHILGNKEW